MTQPIAASPELELAQLVADQHRPDGWGSGFCVGCDYSVSSGSDDSIVSGTKAEDCRQRALADAILGTPPT